MKRATRLLAVCLVVTVAASAVGQEAAGDVEALNRERRRLEREVRGKLYTQLRQIRDQRAKEADLSDLRALIARAQEAYDEKVKTDPKIAAAGQAEKAAARGLAEATAAAVARDPALAQLKKEQQVAERASSEAEFEGRVARFMLSEFTRRITDVPEVRAKRDALSKADRAVRDLLQKNPWIAAAQKAMYQAERDYNAKLKAIPQYTAMVRAREAYEAATKAIPERAAMDRAKAAYEALAKADGAVQTASAAREAAQKAYAEELELALAVDTDVAEQTKKLKKAEADQKAARARGRELRDKMRDAERAVRDKDPRLLQVRKAYDEARRARYKVMSGQTAREQATLDKARRELEEKVRTKLAADPRARPLQEQLDKVNQKIRQLQEQIRELTRKRKRPKTE